MGLSVLVVDDSCLLRWRLKQNLSSASGVARVTQADSYVQARQVLLIDAPDVVVVDAGMSGGLDLLRAIRDARSRIFVIMLASFPVEPYRRSYVAAGADAVFDKSTEFDFAVELVERLARRRLD